MRNRLLLILAIMILVVPAILAQTQEPPASQPAQTPAPAQMGCMGMQAMQKGQTPMSGMMGGDMMKGMMGGDMMKGMMQGGAGGAGCPMRAAATAKPAATKKK